VVEALFVLQAVRTQNCEIPLIENPRLPSLELRVPCRSPTLKVAANFPAPLNIWYDPAITPAQDSPVNIRAMIFAFCWNSTAPSIEQQEPLGVTVQSSSLVVILTLV